MIQVGQNPEIVPLNPFDQNTRIEHPVDSRPQSNSPISAFVGTAQDAFGRDRCPIPMAEDGMENWNITFFFVVTFRLGIWMIIIDRYI